MTGSYNQKYFDKLKSYENTSIGTKLIKTRLKLISWAIKYLKKDRKSVSLIDIGSGSGYLLDNLKIEKKYGYDINPASRNWLKKQGLWVDINKDVSFDIICFFDVLEHLNEPDGLIKRFHKGTVIIISIPIFKNIEKVKDSKHYRPDEHYHYFTEYGIVLYMKQCGYRMILKNNDETLCGREDIMTFVFEKEIAGKNRIILPKYCYRHLAQLQPIQKG